MKTITYKVLGLHCFEETILLKKALAVPGVYRLDFNILEKKMSLVYDPERLQPDQISALIQTTGMEGVVWQEEALLKRGFWKKQGRFLLTVLSGIFLALGFILQIPFFYLFSALLGLWYVLPRAYSSLIHLHFDIYLLMVIASLGAIGIQQWSEAGTIAFLFSLSLYLEHWSTGEAQKAVKALMLLTPTKARLQLSESQYQEVEVEKIYVESVILIKPGEKIPLDCQVMEGSSFIDQSLLTGETTPCLKKEGDHVFAGTLNGDGALLCRVVKAADQTTLARMNRLIEEARSKRSENQQWVETFARYYTPIMLFFAIIIMVLPPLLIEGSWSDWIYRGLVLLVIACPCALVISTPVSIICGLTAAARSGVLIKSGLALETIGKLRSLAVDKTGTLTVGHPEVQKIIPLGSHTEQEVMERAVGLETPSEHPLAKAIVKKGKEMGIKAESASNYLAFKGKGAIAFYKNKMFWIGSHRFLHEMGQETDKIHEQAVQLEDAGHSIIVLGNEEHVCGLISIADAPRSEIDKTIAALKEMGLKQIVLLTGDNIQTASAIAKLCGIEEYHAGLMPEEKVEYILELRKSWGNVGMVGDGVNDAPAMAAATLGIAMGGIGSDVALETSDITLMADDLSRLPWLIQFSRAVLNVIKQNITFSLALKGLFIGLALFNMATLWAAIAADTGATIVVIFNSLRLLRCLKSFS